MESNQQLSSVPPKLTSQMSLNSSMHFESEGSSSKASRIQDLYTRFTSLNSQVTIEHDQSAFNMIEFKSKNLKQQYDPQLVQAKLKRLQNNVELRRIQMEIANRKKKSHKQHRAKEDSFLPQKSNYINAYKDITQNHIEVSYDNSQSEDDQDGQKPKGITYLNELKKHPKLLKYTIEQAKSREKLKQAGQLQKQQKIEQFRNELKKFTNATLQKNDWKRQQRQRLANPEKVTENIFRRFYSKKNQGKQLDKVRQGSRVSQFIEKQDDIINTVDERSLSKENYQKLKQKMGEIASELIEDQKRHRSKTKLPKITVNRTITALSTLSK